EKKVEFFRGEGCDLCRGTGYKGRVAIFEIIELSPAIRHLAIAKAGSDDIMDAAIREGTVSLKDDALRKVLDGETTVEEMARVTGTKVDLGPPEAEAPGSSGEAGEGEEVLPETVFEEEGASDSLSIDDYERQITHWLAKK
ncbi:MAG TPA: hypothetical protein PK636_08790, partial [bacterium]|nr:hypothetical protein [bacterium]